MVIAITPIYRDENAMELNKAIETLLKNLEMEYEGINECVMDLVLNHDERREKTHAELFDNPRDVFEYMAFDIKRDVLNEVISELKNIVYSDYKETPISKKTTSKKLNHGECLMWLGTKVKPLILEGVTSQKEIGERIGTPANTISQRVTRAYAKSWQEYVEFVQQGIY